MLLQKIVARQNNQIRVIASHQRGCMVFCAIANRGEIPVYRIPQALIASRTTVLFSPGVGVSIKMQKKIRDVCEKRKIHSKSVMLRRAEP